VGTVICIFGSKQLHIDKSWKILLKLICGFCVYKALCGGGINICRAPNALKTSKIERPEINNLCRF
jgi:hypothetical protein